MKQTSPLQAAGAVAVDVPAMTPAVCQAIIKQILQETEDAFYLFDVGDVIKKYYNWLETMPRVKPFYAVKCNNHPVLLRVLAALGAGFDCASKTEIQQVLDLGVDEQRIIYANPCKQSSHVRFAVERGVDLMTFDNEAELRKIQRLAPNARLVIRIRMDAADARCLLGIKFGAEPAEALRLLKLALAMQLNVVGVSFHVGSDCREPAVFGRAIRAARAIFDEAELQGRPMTLLDVGGGFPGDQGTSLLPCAREINAALEVWFPETEGLTLIAEPGRYMAASAFTLATQVTSVRHRENAVDYYINDGVYSAFSCVLYDAQVCRPRPLLEEAAEPGPPATIYGPTCDSLDLVCQDVPLPLLAPGSWLLWQDMGAYTLSSGGNFNGFPKAAVYPVVATPLRVVKPAAKAVKVPRRSSENK